MADQKKTAKKKEKPESIERILCRTQGIGLRLAESLVTTMSDDQKRKVKDLASKKAKSEEIAAVLGPQPEPETKSVPKTEGSETKGDK